MTGLLLEVTSWFFEVEKCGTGRKHIVERYGYEPWMWQCGCKGYTVRTTCIHVAFANWLTCHGLSGWRSKDHPMPAVIPSAWEKQYRDGGYDVYKPPLPPDVVHHQQAQVA